MSWSILEHVQEKKTLTKTKHRLCKVEYTTNAGDSQVYLGTCQKKPADHAPVAPDQIISMDQSESG